MATKLHPQRRDFLKATMVGAAGAAGISALKFDKLFAQSTGDGWVTGMPINPAIDNARVICCNDPNMLTGLPQPATFANQNAVVNAAVVDANMDGMAMQLAQKTNAADAWSTIFRTGNAAGWASTRVAIKTNGIGSTNTNRQRVAVIKKVCDVLIGLGVQPSNIVLYDACNDASSFYNPYIDLTDSTKIRAVMSARASSLGGFAPVTLVNWSGGAGTCGCPADLVNGKIDILVNIAVSKINNAVAGNYSFGAITACMKNHFGTFTNSQKAGDSQGLHPTVGKPPLALFEINQHPAILGGNPVRQQLCIVDALFSSTNVSGAPDNVTNRLVMGTFAPMVDYFTANYILLNPAVMTTTPVPQAAITAAATILPQFATSFGYTAPSASPTAPDPSWVSYPASSPPPINPSGGGGASGSADAGGGGGASGSRDAGGGGTSGSADASSSVPSGSQDAGSGGTSGSRDAGGGGTSVSADAGGGGTSVSADAGSGVPSGSVDGGSGVPTGSADAGSGLPTGSADAGSGLPSGSADAASGGTPSGAGGAGGTDGAASSPVSASADAATPGGTSTGTGTGAIPPGGGSGTPGSAAASGNSGCSCDVAGADRRATRWGAMLAFGAVVAEKLRRLAGGNDRSS